MSPADADPVLHVAILPSPGFGHITPVIELARLLVSLHRLRVTVFVITTDASTAQSRLVLSTTIPDGLRIVDLPPSDVCTPVPPDARFETRTSIIVRDALPSLRSSLREASPPPAALVVDIFGTDAFDVADELGLPRYLFFTSTAAALALMVYAPVFDREVEGEYVDLAGPVGVPGCRPFRVSDLLDPMQMKREDVAYQWYLHHCRRFPMARGILVNTCEALEAKPLAAMREHPALACIPTPQVYPVGPVIQSPADHPACTPKCLSWLDSQPTGSVLFVSFGSGGTISAEQTAELAWGLESSRQRFLWVVRRPTQTDSPGTYFTSGGGAGEALDYLPEGFVRRTQGTGLVVPSWAPQLHILGHPAVGGFLTHCGWNSVLESVASGVPMIAWPLYAEQRMNAAMVEEELKVALRVRPDGGVVRRQEVERVVWLLMEGEEGKAMRGRMAELRQSATAALREGGSSRSSLADVVSEWRMGKMDLQSISSLR